MDPQTRATVLKDLAETLRRRQLDGAARLLLDVVSPLGFLASQLALFARPFTPHGRWRTYVDALTDEGSWNELRRTVDLPEC